MCALGVLCCASINGCTHEASSANTHTTNTTHTSTHTHTHTQTPTRTRTQHTHTQTPKSQNISKHTPTNIHQARQMCATYELPMSTGLQLSLRHTLLPLHTYWVYMSIGVCVCVFLRAWCECGVRTVCERCERCVCGGVCVVCVVVAWCVCGGVCAVCVAYVLCGVWWIACFVLCV